MKDENKNSRFKVIKKVDDGYEVNLSPFVSIACLVNAIIICCSIYLNSNTYHPVEHEIIDDNIYSRNSFICTEDEKERIKCDLEERFGVTITDDSSYYLLHAVLNNPNLSEEEKEFFCGYVDLLNENPYLNREQAYRSLLNVKVDYTKRPRFIDEDVNGVYISKYESIGIFHDDTDRSTLAHEAVHCIYCNDETCKLPTYFKEGMTELLTNEYFSDYPYLETDTYPFEIAMIKMMCLATSSDCVLEAFSTGNMDVVAQKLAENTGFSFEDSSRVIEQIDDFFIKYRNGKLSSDRDKNIKLLNDFIYLFRLSTENRYSPEDDERISYYYNELLFINVLDETPYESYIDDIIDYGVDPKAYFCRRLIADEEKYNEEVKSLQLKKNDN